jgi:hypothetical protein
MSDQRGYTTSFLVDQTPAEAFAAVNDVRGWWSQRIDGDTDRLGAEFHYDNDELHQATFRIIELVPDRRVVWKCLDNHFGFTADKTEWIGTTVEFDVVPDAARTRVTFTHVGLVPDYECFDVCVNAWGGYVGGSLRDLITTGRGNPNNAVRDADALSRRR